MKVVVTGATGSIGTALLSSLDDRWDVVGVARRVPPVVGPYARVRWVGCDIGAPGAGDVLAEVFAGADAVVHLAWAIQPLVGDPPRGRTNRRGSAAVLRAVEKAGVGYVLCASSSAAYAPGPRWRRVAEDAPCVGVPGSAYSLDKADLEGRLDLFARRNPGVVVGRVRPSAVVQPAAGAQLARWTVPALLPRRVVGAAGVPVPLWSRLRLQVVHAEDVAQALRLMVERRFPGAVNLAAEPVLPARELASILGGFLVPTPRPLLVAAAWAAWRVGVLPLHPGWLRLADQVPLLDTTRAREELGWRPAHDAASAFEGAVAAMRRGAGADGPPLAANTGGFRVSGPFPRYQSQSPRTIR